MDQRSKAQKELEEEQYQHSIDQQKDALNKQYEDFETQRQQDITDLRLTLEDRELLISQSFETVKSNADIVGQEIAAIATEHGINISNAIITSWKKGENAIASYGNVLSAESSAFIQNIMGVENEVYGLQSQANVTADTLSDMFATRADVLVGELTASYQSEVNLDEMTHILQNSLMNTLERGYNISGITSAFNNIISGANQAASAANKAASAIDRMNSSGGGYSSSDSYDYNSGPGAVSNSSSEKLLPGLPHDGGGIKGKENTWRIVNKLTGKVMEYGLSKTQAEKLVKTQKYGPKYKIQAYAKGGIVTKDKDNPLNEIAKAIGEDTLVAAKEGESFLTPEQTEAVQKQTKAVQEQTKAFQKVGQGFLNPEQVEIVNNINRMIQQPLDKDEINYMRSTYKSHGQQLWQTWGLAGIQAQRDSLQFTKNENANNVSINNGGLVTINGDVNDTNHFIRQIEGISQKVVNKTLNKFDREFRYR